MVRQLQGLDAASTNNVNKMTHFNMNTDDKLAYIPKYGCLDFSAILRAAWVTPVTLELEDYFMYSKTLSKDNH